MWGGRRARRVEDGVGGADYSSAIHAAPLCGPTAAVGPGGTLCRLEADEAIRPGCGGSVAVLRGRPPSRCRTTAGIAGARLSIPHGGMAGSAGPSGAAVRSFNPNYKSTSIARLVRPHAAAGREDPCDIDTLAHRTAGGPPPPTPSASHCRACAQRHLVPRWPSQGSPTLRAYGDGVISRGRTDLIGMAGSGDKKAERGAEVRLRNALQQVQIRRVCDDTKRSHLDHYRQ
jgi:hypothetical protein